MTLSFPRHTSLAPMEIVSDYISPDGPIVTHLRGAAVTSALQVLKKLGHFERYVELLPAEHRDRVLYTISASWVPVEVVMAHALACDAMKLTESELVRQGEYIASLLSETLFGAMARTGRRLGVDGAWTFLKQTGRLFPRMYQGGRCTVLRAGPKDAIVELIGNPLFASRQYRASHDGYMQGLVKSFSTGGFGKAIRPRTPSPHTAATLISWV